ncbi:MAG: hypothetical protein AAGJ87_02105, partial [Pseudomonadota bacterium]
SKGHVIHKDNSMYSRYITFFLMAAFLIQTLFFNGVAQAMQGPKRCGSSSIEVSPNDAEEFLKSYQEGADLTELFERALEGEEPPLPDWWLDSLQETLRDDETNLREWTPQSLQGSTVPDQLTTRDRLDRAASGEPGQFAAPFNTEGNPSIAPTASGVLQRNSADPLKSADAARPNVGASAFDALSRVPAIDGADVSEGQARPSGNAIGQLNKPSTVELVQRYTDTQAQPPTETAPIDQVREFADDMLLEFLEQAKRGKRNRIQCTCIFEGGVWKKRCVTS